MRTKTDVLGINYLFCMLPQMVTSSVYNTCKRERPWDEWTCSFAAWNGHLGCLIRARKRCPWDAYTCSCAAKNGHLECLNTRTKTDVLGMKILVGAAFNGEFECLKYLHENGCPWNEYTCSWAASKWSHRVFEIRARKTLSLE